MSQRGEVHSFRFFAEEGKKTYFFNIKENRFNDLYLVIVESRKDGQERFSRDSIQVFEEMLSPFCEKLEDLLSQFSREIPPLEWSDSLTKEDNRRYYDFFVRKTRNGATHLVLSEKKTTEQDPVQRNMIRINLQELPLFIENLLKAQEYILGEGS